jgi:signal peptidase II
MKKKYIIIIIIALIIVLLDQVSKYLIIANLDLYEEFTIIDNFFIFTHVKNTGISYGGFSDAPRLFFLAVYILSGGVFYYLIKDLDFDNNQLYSYSVAMMVGGAIGNLIDRVIYAEVTDFLSLIVFNKAIFGVFNIADIFLVVGMIIFAIDVLFEDVLKWKKSKSQK